jgi:1-acylglycerol-3-phosphate O-acyltransferase
MLYALYYPQDSPPKNSRLTTVADLVRDNPDASILVMPECTTTNGRGILPFSPSLLSAGPRTKIFPINLRYTPADITTPVPGTWLTFLWNLCSKPTHCIRVRIAERVYNVSAREGKGVGAYDSSHTDETEQSDMRERNGGMINGDDTTDDDIPSGEEQRVLDQIGESLARLGRVKRVNLGVQDKKKFVAAWSKNRRIW